MKIYYVSCVLCSYYELVTSLQEAKEKLEKHEQLNHKSKPVGSFGYKEES